MAIVHASGEWRDLCQTPAFYRNLRQSVCSNIRVLPPNKQRIFAPTPTYFMPNVHESFGLVSTPISDPATILKKDKDGPPPPSTSLGMSAFVTQLPYTMLVSDIDHALFVSVHGPVPPEHAAWPLQDVVDTYDGDTFLRVCAMYPCTFSSELIGSPTLRERFAALDAELSRHADDGTVESTKLIAELFSTSRSTIRTEAPYFWGNSTVRNHVMLVSEDMKGTELLDKQKRLELQEIQVKQKKKPNAAIGDRTPISLDAMGAVVDDFEEISPKRVLLVVETSIPSISRFLWQTARAEHMSIGDLFSSAQYRWARAFVMLNNMRVAQTAVSYLSGPNQDLACIYRGSAESLLDMPGMEWTDHLSQMLREGMLLGETPLVAPAAVSYYNALHRMPNQSIVYARNMVFSPARPVGRQMFFCGPVEGYILYDFIQGAYDKFTAQRPDFMNDIYYGVQDPTKREGIIQQMTFPRDCGREGDGLKVIEPRHLSFIQANGKQVRMCKTLYYSAYAASLGNDIHLDPFFAAYPTIASRGTNTIDSIAAKTMLRYERPIEYYIPRSYTDVIACYVGKPPYCFRTYVHPTFVLMWNHAFDHEHYNGIKLPRNTPIVHGVAELVLDGVIRDERIASVFKDEDIETNQVSLLRAHVEKSARFKCQLLKEPNIDYMTCLVRRGASSDIA